MGEVRYNGRKYKNVSVVVIRGDLSKGEGCMDIHYEKGHIPYESGHIQLVYLRTFQKKTPWKRKRYEITGNMKTVHLDVGNCLTFKGQVGTVDVGNVAHCLCKPVQTESKIIEEQLCSYYHHLYLENHLTSWWADKPRYDVIHLDGMFERIEVSPVNVTCLVDLKGKAENVTVGNCLNLDGQADCLEAGNRIFTYEKRGSEAREKQLLKKLREKETISDTLFNMMA